MTDPITYPITYPMADFMRKNPDNDHNFFMNKK